MRHGKDLEKKREYQHPDGKKRNWKEHNPDNSVCFKNKHLKDSKEGRPITAPATEQAKALDGAYSGFQPKPAVEVIIVAMKPIEERTYVDQALKNRHGITWLDDCLIPLVKDVDDSQIRTMNRSKKEQEDGWGMNNNSSDKPQVVNPKGRFPANVLCEDDVLDDGTNHKGIKGGGPREYGGGGGWNNAINRQCVKTYYGDEGGFNRFFSLDTWFAERIKLLPKEAQKTFPWLIVPKASKSEKNRGCEKLVKGNYHPTCKPLKLMSWLITLGSREGDIILDPFVGSGTTAIAANMLGRQYIGIEKEAESCEIARKRIASIPSSRSSSL